jgi:4-amino-4-deoxy-L-arabinose transferase-like glycosyltransferase
LDEQQAPMASADAPLSAQADPVGAGRTIEDRARRTASAVAVVLRRHWIVVLVCLVTVAVRLPLILWIHAQPASDSFFYVSGADSLAHGHGYSILGHPTAFFPVGWPAFLAGVFLVTGVSFFAVMVANVVLWTVITVLIYAFATRLGGRAAGAVAALLIALDPNLIPYVLRAASESLFVPLLIGMCLLLQRRPPAGPSLRAAAGAGLLLGLAILVRSTAAPLPFVVGAWLLLAHRRRAAFKPAVVFVAVACLVVAPWVVRNRLVMHSWVLSTNGGYTLWIGDNPKANGSQNAPGYSPWPIASVQQEVSVNAITTRESFHFITHDFDRWMDLIPAKAHYLFAWSPGAFANAFILQPRADPLAMPASRPLDQTEQRIRTGVEQHYWLMRDYLQVFWIVSALALVLAVAYRRPGAGLVALIVLFWVAMHVTVIHGQPRYMVSVSPLLVAPIGWLITLPFEQLRRRLRP